VIQRVSQAQVSVEQEVVGSIEKGLCVLLCAMERDEEADLEWVLKKCLGIRIFSDENNKMNLSLKDVNGSLLVVSQFTLAASTKKGNRPSFGRSLEPQRAKEMVDEFVKRASTEVSVATGIFAADMNVSLVNDGPVTIYIDSQLKE